ncbi:MAG TPA: T9SS type A sorting domain-containing protein, partial [Prolixibacteraceae bacterium]
NGIDFVRKNGNNGKIVLLSDGDQYGDYQVANTLINDILKLMNPKIPIHISDYQSINYPSYYKDGQYFYGNDYFYSNLSRMTLGSYHTVRNNLSISEAIHGSLKYLGGMIKSFDLHTSLKTGFCYSRYTMTNESDVAYVDEAILQVGKFKGEFPFIVEITGEYNNEVFSEMMEIQKPAGLNNDSIAEEMWTGQYIKKLESGTQSNDIINQIIYSSLSERVLSSYTSFICLEDTNYICNNCATEQNIIIGVKELSGGQDSMLVYPNPFVDKVAIDLMCSNPTDVKELSIVDVTGSAIYRFPTTELQKGKNVLAWNGLSASGDRVKPGVYLLVYKTTGYVKTIRIVRK